MIKTNSIITMLLTVAICTSGCASMIVAGDGTTTNNAPHTQSSSAAGSSSTSTATETNNTQTKPANTSKTEVNEINYGNHEKATLNGY